MADEIIKYKPSEMAAAILAIPNFIEIVVKAPSGIEVTAEKDGIIYTAKETNGTYQIYVVDYGTYTIKAVCGDDDIIVQKEVQPPMIVIQSGTAYLADENNNAITFDNEMVAVIGKLSTSNIDSAILDIAKIV